MKKQIIKTTRWLVAAATLNMSSITKAQNVGISSTGLMPDNSAGLDVNFSNKGLLIPRVALTSVNDAATIPSPATSLLVYNNGTGGLTPAGYYYNAGTPGSPNWVRLMPATGTGGAWLITGNAGLNATINFLGTTDNVDLVFRTNNTERMRILSSNGNVGIGISSPLNRLHVGGGDVRIGELNPPGTGTLPGYGRMLFFSGGPAGIYNSDNSDVVWIARYNKSSDYTEIRVNLGDNCEAGDAFVIQSSGGGGGCPANKSLFRVQADGRVKIGTNASPLPAKLEVYDSSDVAFISVSANLAANGTQGYVGYRLGNSDQSWAIYQGDPDGGFGVGPRNFEIWEYPSNPGSASECCRRRLIIENTYSMFTGQGPVNIVLQSNGNVCTYGSFVGCSDERLKKDFRAFNDVLDKINSVDPFYYKWDVENYPNKFNDTTIQIGFKAKEMEKYFPYLVSMDSEGYRQIKYDKITVVLWKAIQELYEENSQLKHKVVQLEQQNKLIVSELKVIKQHIGIGEAKK